MVMEGVVEVYVQVMVSQDLEVLASSLYDIFQFNYHHHYPAVVIKLSRKTTVVQVVYSYYKVIFIYKER